jgi:hypothetical protein
MITQNLMLRVPIRRNRALMRAGEIFSIEERKKETFHSIFLPIDALDILLQGL